MEHIALDWTHDVAARYAALDMEPLEVVLELRNGMVSYDPLNLDNLLARCVVDQHTEGCGLADVHDGGYALPVPLHCLWRDRFGFPLWAATQFMPEGVMFRDVAYLHKRPVSGEWTGTKRGRLSIQAGSGRHAARRMPYPVIGAERWIAHCVGNADAIAELLEPLAFVGKKRAAGFGEIRRWIVRRGPEFALVRDGALTRPLPAMAIALLGGRAPEGAPAPIGWTPPQWKAALFAPGWWTGAPVDEGSFR